MRANRIRIFLLVTMNATSRPVIDRPLICFSPSNHTTVRGINSPCRPTNECQLYSPISPFTRPPAQSLNMLTLYRSTNGGGGCGWVFLLIKKLLLSYRDPNIRKGNVFIYTSLVSFSPRWRDCIHTTQRQKSPLHIRRNTSTSSHINKPFYRLFIFRANNTGREEKRRRNQSQDSNLINQIMAGATEKETQEF